MTGQKASQYAFNIRPLFTGEVFMGYRDILGQVYGFSQLPHNAIDSRIFLHLSSTLIECSLAVEGLFLLMAESSSLA